MCLYVCVCVCMCVCVCVVFLTFDIYAIDPLEYALKCLSSRGHHNADRHNNTQHATRNTQHATRNTQYTYRAHTRH
jgi:hypothetical protein